MPYPLTGKARQLRQEVYRILEALSKPETDDWHRAALLLHTENLLESIPEQNEPTQPAENAEPLAYKLLFTVITTELKKPSKQMPTQNTCTASETV